MTGIPELRELFANCAERLIQTEQSRVVAQALPVDFDEGERIITIHLLEAVRGGGNLAIVEEPPEWEAIPPTHEGISAGFRNKAGSKPNYFLCRFFDCNFDLSVELIPTLCKPPFPADSASDPQTFDTIKTFLREMYRRQEVAIAEYLSGQIAVRQIGKPKSDWHDEVKNALSFCETKLGVLYSPRERKAYVDQFTKFGFFTLPVPEGSTPSL